jgi:hypothetical protein
MIINADLRMAIRSAYNIKKKSEGNRHQDRTKAEQDAISNFLKENPKALKKLSDAKAKTRAARAVIEAATITIRSFGLEVGRNGEAYRINSHEQFTKAGGKLIIVDDPKWSFDQVIAELAAADGKRATEILSKYGINWK